MKRTAYFALMLLSSVALAAVSPGPRTREALRVQLQTLLNDAELTIRNQNAMKQSLEKQGRDIGYLKVFERIPFDDRRQALREELARSAEPFGVSLLELRFLKSSARLPLPRVLYTDDPPFQPDARSLVRELGLAVRVQGDETKVLAWLKSWPHEVLRWVEPVGRPRSAGTAGRWEIDARAFAFWKLPAPTVRIRDPNGLLPKAFSHDPGLVNLVSRIETIRPKAEPLLKGRGPMLLDRARLEYFLRKSLGSG